MNRLLLILLVVLAAAPVRAQLSPTLARMVGGAETSFVPGGTASALGVADDRMIGVVIRTNDPAALRLRGVQIVSTYPGLVTARVPLAQVEGLLALSSVAAVELEYEVSHNDAAAVLTGARALNQGIVGNRSYEGTGVLACVLDSGIDWRHMDFRVAGDPTKTRILRLWDQTDTANGSPDAPGVIGGVNFSYGAEWDKAEMEAAFSNPTAIRQTDTDGHGTHVAGTLAGNGGSLTPAQHVGMAPKADLIVIKAGNGSFSSANIINGITYCDEVATSLGRPAVMNMSLGSTIGAHDGTDSKSAAINAFAAKAGRVLVQSAGNAGGDGIHVERTVPAGGSAAGIVISAAAGGAGSLGIDIWVAGQQDVSATVTTPGGTVVQVPNMTNATVPTPEGNLYVFNFLQAQNGDRRIYIQPDVASQGAVQSWTITLSNAGAAAATAHGWQFAGGSVVGSVAGGNGAYTIDNAAAGGIAVGAYMHRFGWCSPTGCRGYPSAGQDGITSFSSLGPSRDGRTLPHITGPGQLMISTKSINEAANTTFDMPGGLHSGKNGTSMSSPAVAGVVALLLEQDATLTGAQAKALVQANALTEPRMGALPNNTWGPGKVNAFNAMTKLIESTSTITTEVISYASDLNSSSDVTNATPISLRFRHGQTDNARLRGVMFYASSTVNLTDDLDIEVWSNQGGVPGAKLSGGTFDDAAAQKFGWNYASLDALETDLMPGVDYHLVLRPRGSNNLFVRRATAAQGNSLQLSGATWSQTTSQWGIRPVVSTTDPSSLPVELTSFSVAAEGQDARLVWQTASETANDGFTVEHQAPAREWSRAGWVKGAGTTLETNSYAFRVADLAPGVHRFRLRQTDLDGTTDLSPIVEIAIEAAHELGFASVAPSPVTSRSQVAFTVPRDGEARLELFDSLGRLVAVLHDGEAQAGNLTTSELDAVQLSAGVYVMRLSQSGKQVTRSVVVAR